jgi:peptidoglycan/LPS O-acetylase OafA/YrhL
MKEIRALTGIRGIAALIVFLSHLRDNLSSRGVELPVSDLFKNLFLIGGRQVDIFFVLSGFILALTYQKWFDTGVASTSYLVFLRKRFARIYPLHAVMLLLTVTMVLAAQHFHVRIMNGIDRFTFSSLPKDFLLIHAWPFIAKSGTEEMVWNPPSWSISIEALAYLIFPVFLSSTFGLRKRHPWILVGVGIAFGFACNAVVPWDRTGFPGALRGLSEFALGCITANLFTGRAADWLRTNLGAATALALMAIIFAFTPETWFGIGLVTAPLLLALSGRNVVSAVFGFAPIYFLGEISYSIYLGHFLFSSIGYRVVNVEWMKSGPLQTLAGILAITMVVVLLSTVTYYTIEKPGRDLLGGKRKAARVAAASTAQRT